MAIGKRRERLQILQSKWGFLPYLSQWNLVFMKKELKSKPGI
jgi:hypothetical protein